VILAEAVHAEWTKLRTAPGNCWLLLATAALTVTVSAVVDAAVGCSLSSTCQPDVARLSVTGIWAGQAVVAILAVLVISDEYSTGMIRTTLAAIPRRTTVLAAKAAVLGGVVLCSGTVGVAGSILAGRLILPGRGYTVAHGYLPLSLADGPTLRAAAGSVLYLTLIALLGLGAATALRNSAAAIAGALGLLYVFPLFAQVTSNPTWHRRYEQIGPMTAGLAIQATKNLGQLPIAPWSGLGVLAAWAAGAMIAGWLVLHVRDA
jgi:ABC-2 type transport system permease protein